MFADTIKRGLAPRLARRTARQLQAQEAKKTPAMRQHEYMVARQSILGDLSSLPVSATQECISNEKARRRKERLKLVNSHVVACPEHEAQAARLRNDMDEVENMRCAKHVYLANDPDAPPELRDNPPPGFLKPTPEQLAEMGLDEGILSPRKSNFRACVYIKDPAVWGANPKPRSVLAFRGSTPEEEDWDNNFSQDANREADYYRRAVQIGNKLGRCGADLHIVGHSLGGGLASAAQGGSGLTASTYNAAGLHPVTVARYSQDRSHLSAEAEKITAVRVKGEVLTKTQENLLGSSGLSLIANEAVGKKRDLMPSHGGEYFAQLGKEGKIDNNPSYDTNLHGMDEVIASMEASKASDEVALKNCRNTRR